MNVPELILLAQVIAVASMLVTYAISVHENDLGWVDVGWSVGIGLVAILFAALADGVFWRRMVVGGLAAAWSLRLAVFIGARVIRGDEDARYKTLRARWGERTNQYALVLFLVESLLIVLFSVPFLVVMLNPDPSLTLWDLAGILVWIIAVSGESIADRQLDRFRNQPENSGKTCREGLWRYSRHPNYFFEWVHWFAYAAMAVGIPGGGWTLIGPVLMFLFLFKVTGIPFAEKQSLARRGEDYRRYQETTSMFIPWFPKQEGES